MGQDKRSFLQTSGSFPSKTLLPLSSFQRIYLIKKGCIICSSYCTVVFLVIQAYRRLENLIAKMWTSQGESGFSLPEAFPL